MSTLPSSGPPGAPGVASWWRRWLGRATAFGAWAYLVVALGNPYLWEIVIPGTLLGIIVGYATQRFTPAARKVAPR